jgi:predicted dehydrogenase
MDCLRLGIAGLGMAQARVLPELARLPYVKIAAAADLRAEALKAFERRFGGRTFSTVEEMCDFDGIDAIYVATPHEYHAPHAIYALEHGKHVIVEKPVALSLDDIQKMNAAADRNHLKLLAGHTHSFDLPICKMAELVKGGSLGRPLMINSSYYKDHLFRPFSDHDIRMSRGVVLNQGPHQIDIVRQIAGGMATTVRARTGAAEPSRPGEGHYACLLQFEGDLAASLTYSGYAYLDSGELTWWLDEDGRPKDKNRHRKGRAFFRSLGKGRAREQALEKALNARRFGDDTSFRVPSRAGRKQPFFGLTIVTCEKGDIRQSPNGLYIYDENGRHEIKLTGGVSAREAEIAEFFTAIREDRMPAHDGRWAQATLEVCLAILESSKSGQEIRLKYQVPSQPPLVGRVGIKTKKQGTAKRKGKEATRRR